MGRHRDQWLCLQDEKRVIISANNNQKSSLRTMISWLKQPVTHLTTWVERIRFYAIAIILVAASVPFFHLYMDDQLSFVEVAAHTLSVALSTAVAILLFELILRVYLKRKTRKWNLSTGLFWLLLFSVFALAFVVMHATHNFFPITLDIWNKHIKHDLETAPWKVVPIALLIGYILIQLTRRYQIAQELADLKKLNEQLQAVRDGVESLDGDIKEGRDIDTPGFFLPYQGENLYLDPALIIRVESDENYCHVLVAPNEAQDGGYCYMARITLNEVASRLPENLFLQVHRSHIVNFTYVVNLERQGRNYQLQLTNGDCIPVSRSRIKQIRQKTLGILSSTGMLIHGKSTLTSTVSNKTG